MSDSVEASQYRFDAKTSGRDANESIRHSSILFRKNGAQIENHAAFFYPGNDRRLRGTQTRSQVISAQTVAGYSQQSSGQNRRGHGAAAQQGFTVHNFNLQ